LGQNSLRRTIQNIRIPKLNLIFISKLSYYIFGGQIGLKSQAIEVKDFEFVKLHLYKKR